MAELKPFPYQNEGIEYGLKNKRFILGDEPGLGKSCVSIHTVLKSNSFPCLVICPASLKLNWQREWHMWSDRKAMILNDANRHSWWMFAKPELNPFGTGAKADVFIVNYESLKKYFVQDIARGELKLSNITFKPQISMFKSVIIDEVHRCFPYDSKVVTNKGLLNIGEIVKEKDKNLLVLSMDLSSNSVSYKRILNYYENETKGRKFYKIKHSRGTLVATEGHQIYVDGKGYKKIQEIKSGDYLRMVWKKNINSKGREVDSQILRKIMCCVLQKLKSRNKGENGCSQKAANTDEKMRMVQRGFSCEQKVEKRFCQEVLQPKLFCQMENVPTWGYRFCKNGGVFKESQRASNRTNERSCVESYAFKKDDKKQPYGGCGNERKGFTSIVRTTILRGKDGERTHNKTSNNIMAGIRAWFQIFGISCFDEGGKRRKPSLLLQNRHCINKRKNCNRSGRGFSQGIQSKKGRYKKDYSVKLVRVESCEIQKRRDPKQLRFSGRKSESVYNIEVEGNHNYFVNGVLVHNCKEPSTQQSKFVKGIVNGKEFILALTGTPIVNTQEDLVSILGILDRLKDFGGASMFRAKWLDKSKLPELGEKLKETCFIRRRKSEVLKDLPAKLRSIFPTELSNQEEYDIALNDLKKYLVEYKQKTDAEAARLLRMKALVQIGILKGISARGKIDTVVEHVNEVTKAGEKIVLFCHLREVGTALKEAFPDACVIRGGMAGHMKQANIDRFQNDPEAMVCICSIKAAGVGITLTASSRVSFIELPWHPADLEQTEDRCIVEGEPILTPDGWRPIEDIKVGDLVINKHGNPVKVKDAWSKGNTKLVTEVNVQGFGVLKTTNNHRYLTSEGWREASFLMPGDELIMPKQEISIEDLKFVKFDNDCRISKTFLGAFGMQRNGRLNTAPEFVEITDLSLFVFGYFVGDGFASVGEGKGRFISVAGHKENKRESLDKCKKWFSEIGINFSEYQGSDNGCEVRAYSGEWAKFFHKHFGQKAHGKQLPEFLMYLNERQSRILLSGLMSSDGYYRKNRFEYVTASDKLCSQVARLILRAGFKPTVAKNMTGQHIIAYSLSQTNNTAKVKSVFTYFPQKPNGKRPMVYDLTTDDTESFVLGLSVVHNCHRIGQKDSVQCTYFLGKGTIDNYIYQIIDRKREIANLVTGDVNEIEVKIQNELFDLLLKEV